MEDKYAQYFLSSQRPNHPPQGLLIGNDWSDEPGAPPDRSTSELLDGRVRYEDGLNDDVEPVGH